jgi:hypothetical protein
MPMVAVSEIMKSVKPPLIVLHLQLSTMFTSVHSMSDITHVSDSVDEYNEPLQLHSTLWTRRQDILNILAHYQHMLHLLDLDTHACDCSVAPPHIMPSNMSRHDLKTVLAHYYHLLHLFDSDLAVICRFAFADIESTFRRRRVQEGDAKSFQ